LSFTSLGVLVDTNVVLDLVQNDPQWADWSETVLSAWAARGPLYINPLIYSELSVAYAKIEELERVLQWLGLILIEPPREALFLAGKAFLQYRNRGGTRTTILPDYFIGAHAAIGGIPLLSRDPKRYRQAFPSVRLITPG
jgi:predicted nucleic acid-binding protein